MPRIGQYLLSRPETEPEATGIFKDHMIQVDGRRMVLTYSEGPGRPLQ